MGQTIRRAGGVRTVRRIGRRLQRSAQSFDFLIDQIRILNWTQRLILHEDLHLHSYKIKIVQALNHEDHEPSYSCPSSIHPCFSSTSKTCLVQPSLEQVRQRTCEMSGEKKNCFKHIIVYRILLINSSCLFRSW